MKLSEYLKQNGMSSKEYFDMQKRKSKGKTTLTDYRKTQEISLKNKIGFETLDSDLKELGTTVESIYNGWQSQDTMNNTKASIVSMQERLNAYQEYAKLFGGEDVSELAKGYQSVLDDWDNRASTYGKFKTAEDYTKAAEREKSLPTADLNTVQAEVADLDKQIAEIKAQKEKYDSDYKANGGYVPSASNSNRPSNNQIEPYQEWRAQSFKYDNQIQDLENQRADRQAFYDDAKTTQETLATVQKETAFASDPNNMDGYNQYIANYDAARAEEKAKKGNTPWLVDAIGNIGGSGDTVSETVKTVVKNKQEDKTWQLPQGDWSDDEKRVLGGYFNEDPQKALDYVVRLNNEKAKGEQAKTEESIKQSATSNVGAGALHTAGSILAAPFALADYMDDVTDKLAGRPIIEESFVTPFEYSQAVTGGISTHLNDLSGTLNENVPVLGGKGLGDAYGLGTSVLQSATSAYTLGSVGTLISYFGQGAAAGVDDALSRGATDDQALAYGLVLGAAEGISENIGAERLLNLGSPNEVRKLLVNAFKKGGGKQFWSLVDKQGKAEALEELFSGVAGQVADNWIMQGKSNFDALTREYRALGMSATEANKKAWMQSIGDVAYDALSGYLSGAVHAAPQIGVSAFKQNAENKTVGKEIRGNDRVTDMLNIASLSPQESDALEAYNQYAKRGVTAENITDAQLGNLYGMAEAEAVSTVLSKKSKEEQKADAETTYNRLAKMKTENKAAQIEKDLAQTDEEGVVTPTTREMVINEQAKGMSEAEANLFRLVDDGKANVGDYADSFNLVVALARNERDQDYILEHRGVLSTAQVDSIYKAVVANPKMAQQKSIETLIKEQGDNLEIKGTVDDSVIDYNNTGAKGKVNWNSIHPNAQAVITTISGFATKVAGMDVKLVTNGRDYGFKGMYDRQGNTLYIDITASTEKVAGADTKGRKDNAKFIISTVSHEVTHWMEEKAPELYAQYSKMVMDTLTTNKSYEQVIGERLLKMQAAENARAKKENRKPREITEKDARREVVAIASEDMLAMSEEGKKFFESLTENEQKQFVDKIKEVIQNIKDWIKNVLSNLRSDSPEAVELRALAKDLDAISKKWDEMLRQAAKANAAMKKAGVNDKAIMESKTDGDTQNADIDTYTTKQYNDFGWVAVNNVLTGKELKKLYSQFAKVKLNKEYNFKNKLGEYLIPVGNRYGSIDKIVYIKGTNKHPIVRQVVVIKNPYREYAEKIVEEVMDYEATGLYYDAFEIYESYAGEEIFNVHKVIDYPSYSELKKGARGQDGRGTYGDNRERNDGASVPETRTGEVRGNDGEISYSDIDDFNLDDYTLDDLLKMTDEDFQKVYESLGLDDLFSSDDSPSLYGGEDVSIEEISEELNTEPEKIEILIRREGLGASHVEENHTAVMTQERIDRGIKESGARFSPGYARRYITRISPKDFIDLTVSKSHIDRDAFDTYVEGDSGSKMGDFDYESALRNSEQSPYLSIDRTTGRIVGHNGRHRIRALEMAGIEAVEIEVELYDEDGYLIKYGSETIPDMAISSQFDTAIETHIANIIPLNETHRAEIESAYGEKAHANAGVQYSDIDSEGNELTAEQQEFFKNSKVRDADGNLLVVYHGTGADFTVFDINRSGQNYEGSSQYGRGMYFAGGRNGALAWSGYTKHVKAYLDIRNPFYAAKPTPEELLDEIPGAKQNTWAAKNGEYFLGFISAKGVEDTTKWLQEHGYDGIIDDGATNNYGGLSAQDKHQYVAFRPNQIKLTTNTNPTEDPDIRYSDIDELDDLNAQLKEKQNQIYSATMELRKFDVKAEEEKLYAVLNKEGASQEELDKALQDFSNWGKESGYAEAHEKQSALKEEERLLRREIQKVEDRLHAELKEQIAHWDEEDVKKYVAKAVRKYHTTTRLDKASYLVTTGSMLDFSDGQGYRVKDHREISEILDLPDYAEYSDGMIAFMNMGNIRLQTYGIDISAMPNAKQISTLRDIISYVMRENDEFSVDFSKTDGYSAGSVTYGKGTSASKIIADIKSYFETGVVPEEQSSLREFLYSDIDVEVDIYEILGENKRLNKENKTLRADFERLMELSKLEKQLTHGKKLNENQLEMVAGHIRNFGNSNYSKTELVNKLREVYTHIATSDNLAWDDLFARFYGIAEDVLGDARPVRSPNDYYANIYRDLRKTEISLSDEQKQYVKDMLGVDSHKAFFGKIKVSDKGIPFNSKWEEWAGKYPNEFAETNDKDQVLALLDIYETAKELKEVIEEYDKVEQARWLANEIYNQYWNVSTIRTTADKHDAQIKRLKYEHRNAMKELRDSYNERVEKQKQIDRAERSRIFKKLREDHIKELKEIRKSGKERLDKYKEDAARKTRMQSVTSQALSLNEMLVKNSKDKHIPEAMRGPVINLLQAIDFSSKRALGMWGGDMKGVPTAKDISLQKALSQVKEMMADASVGKEDLVELYGHDLDPDIKAMVESVDNIMRAVGDNEFILNKMTLDDLITLDKVVKTIKSAVTKMNQFHTVHHAKGIANLAQEEINYAEKLGKAKIYKDKSLKTGVRKLLAWKNINPYYAFKRFGDAGKKIFEAFQDGYDKFAFNIKQIIDFTNSAYKREEVREWEKEIKTFKLRMPVTEQELSNPDYEQQYQEVQMTVAQIMDLYLLNKREAAKVHLLGGGIRVANIETKKGEVISQSEGAILEQDEIDKIINTLTPRQIEVANALSQFMNTVTTEWGNDVSMARFGYRAFGEKNYVPMQVDKNNVAVDDETEKNNSLFRLLNMSFTKSLTEGANNRLVISSIFDVFAQHTSDMAKYNALALPVLDAFRWYNYKEKGYKAGTAFVTKSVKQAIENAFGKEGQGYITTFLKDLNGQENTSRDTLGKGFLTRAKIAAVGANIRVALLQPTAFLRASANIAPKYLFKGVSLLNLKKSIGLAEKYCGMALWKSLGYFDTNVQRGVADQIKHAESKYEKAIELSMKGAEWADKVTFGWLWNAAENEIKETRKDLKVGSEEFYTEVGKRLRDIIYATQVVDSVMTRSEMMRSPDRFDKFLTTFASEPTISYSMLADAYIQTQLDAREMGSKKAAITKNAKRMARVVTAYTVTNLAAALVESVFDILRDNDDDDEEDAWELGKLYLGNFLTNQSIAAKIPWLKEAVSIAQGFSSSRLDTQGMQAFANFVKQIFKLTQGDGSWGKTIKSGLQSTSYLSGLPFYNAYRDALAFFDWLTPEELDELLKDFY